MSEPGTKEDGTFYTHKAKSDPQDLYFFTKAKYFRPLKLMLQDQSTGVSSPHGFCLVPCVSVDVARLSSSRPCKMAKSLTFVRAAAVSRYETISSYRVEGRLILVSVIALSPRASARYGHMAWASSADAPLQVALVCNTVRCSADDGSWPWAKWKCSLKLIWGLDNASGSLHASSKIDIRDTAPTNCNLDMLITSSHRHHL